MLGLFILIIGAVWLYRKADKLEPADVRRGYLGLKASMVVYIFLIMMFGKIIVLGLSIIVLLMIFNKVQAMKEED